MTTEYIYGLLDPTNSTISYIGRTSDPMSRWDGHVVDESDTTKTTWLRRLRAVGISPILVILEKVEGERNAAEVERLWIDMGLRIGWPLTNSLLMNGTKYKRREIDRFSESIADWLISNHFDRLVNALSKKLPSVDEAPMASPVIDNVVAETKEVDVVPCTDQDDLLHYAELANSTFIKYYQPEIGNLAWGGWTKIVEAIFGPGQYTGGDHRGWAERVVAHLVGNDTVVQK